MKDQIGKNIYFDLVDHEKVRSFRIQKQLPFTSFKVMIQKTVLVFSYKSFQIIFFGYYWPICKGLRSYICGGFEISFIHSRIFYCDSVYNYQILSSALALWPG